MTIEYFTDINDVDKNKALLLIESSLQAYRAFDEKTPTKCLLDNIFAPEGYETVRCWSGVDAIFNKDKTIEIFGVVFRSKAAPYTYIFAFRGTTSVMDMIDDLGVEHTAFIPFDKNVKVPAGVEVESGFFDVYTDNKDNTSSMQSQLFSMVDEYNASDKKIDKLYITGHSLGSALSVLFTLDMALSRPGVNASNYNYACPRVGNKKFADFYNSQPAQQTLSTATIHFQNTYDLVPCVPPEDLDYKHTRYALLVAFYEKGFIDKYNILMRHSSYNYQAVLQCAAGSSDGVCINDDLVVKPAHTSKVFDNVSSFMPDKNTVCDIFDYSENTKK